MNPKAYCIISETTEDRFDETDSLEEAIRIARAVARKSQAGALISIEHRGRVIRQLVLLPDGRVAEEETG
jgi:DNA integrity scanning protein DisA with diadenylate cyclase activity